MRANRSLSSLVDVEIVDIEIVDVEIVDVKASEKLRGSVNVLHLTPKGNRACVTGRVMGCQRAWVLEPSCSSASSGFVILPA